MGVGFGPSNLALAIALHEHNETATAPLSAAEWKVKLCKELDLKVAALDDLARQPHTGSEQDRISRQRRDARNEQFRLRCGR